ncbi:hypothetical protein J4731_23610 [Providencia rettgeri]|nr:hypothetical protein [Providencia rettgeri]
MMQSKHVRTASKRNAIAISSSQANKHEMGQIKATNKTNSKQRYLLMESAASLYGDNNVTYQQTKQVFQQIGKSLGFRTAG